MYIYIIYTYMYRYIHIYIMYMYIYIYIIYIYTNHNVSKYFKSTKYFTQYYIDKNALLRCKFKGVPLLPRVTHPPIL